MTPTTPCSTHLSICSAWRRSLVSNRQPTKSTARTNFQSTRIWIARCWRKPRNGARAVPAQNIRISVFPASIRRRNVVFALGRTETTCGRRRGDCGGASRSRQQRPRSGWFGRGCGRHRRRWCTRRDRLVGMMRPSIGERREGRGRGTLQSDKSDSKGVETTVRWWKILKQVLCSHETS